MRGTVVFRLGEFTPLRLARDATCGQLCVVSQVGFPLTAVGLLPKTLGGF